MGSKKKQIILIIILILAIVAAGLFVLHETKSDKAADVDEPSFAPNERPELSILLPKTKYDDVEDFIKKYNAEDNKYFINYQLTGRDYETDPDVINPADADPDDYDGLIIPGGKHVHPSFYGEEDKCDRDHKFDQPLDELEFDLVDRFIEAKKPILGLCRGCQLINVALGGTLNQEIGMEHYNDAVRETTILPGTFFYNKLGDSVETVHYHHQAVDKLADGLSVTMTDTEDGTIEGYVHEELPIIAYQFHPDRMYVKDDPEIVETGLFFMDYFFNLCYANR